MKKIVELNFGFPDAENYKRRETKQLFNTLFIQNEFLEQLCQPEISFLIGDKGTGKTAYSLYLANNKYKDNFAFSKFIRETDYQKFITLKKEKNLQLSDYTSIWKVILLLLLSEEIYDKEPNLDILKNFGKFKYLHDAIQEYYYEAFSPEIIQAIQFIEESNISAELLSKHATLAGEEKESKTFDKNRFQMNLFYIQKKFKDAISNIKIKNNHILFIDGIDIRPDNVPFEDYLECIKGLATAVWELNNDFFPTMKDCKGRARIVLLVRPDIFESLGLQNLNTKIRSNSVLLNWVTEYKEYKNSKLFNMIDNILNSQQKEKKGLGDSWQHYFPFDAHRSNQLKFQEYTSFIQFLRFSYYRPRDIITMLDFLKDNVSADINKETFDFEDFENNTFKNNYSQYILGEIKDQLLFYYQQEEYELFLKFFEFLNGRPGFNYDEYLEIYSKYSKYIDSTSKSRPKFTATANEFLQFLYDLNIICYIEHSKDLSEKFIHWCFKEKSYSNLSPKIKENREYQIFYSLTKALKIGKEYSDTYFDNEKESIRDVNSLSDFKDKLQSLNMS
ncbi:hypothetical protein [Arcobacter sp. s6]|uniref:P-loop ATPase, Sll1717 family n=1 Tax=Arcobacter sp. s6 TaxID=3230363 RepID=UPI00349FFB22